MEEVLNDYDKAREERKRKEKEKLKDQSTDVKIDAKFAGVIDESVDFV